MNKIATTLALCGAVACSGGKERAPAPAPAPEQPAPPQQQPAGPAYFGVRSEGIVKLDAGGFSEVLDVDALISDIDIAPDGTVWVVSTGGVYRISGTEAGMIGDSLSPGPLSRVAGGPDGAAWAVGYAGIAHYAAGTWTVEPREAEASSPSDVAVDAQGRAWVVSSHQVQMRDGDAWVDVDVGTDPARSFFSEIEVAADGAVYVTGHHGVRVLRDGAWTAHPLRTGYTGVDHVGAASGGELRALSGIDDLFAASDGATARITPKTAGYVASSLHDVDLDAAGRTWLATDYGVVILDTENTLLQQWAPGTVPAIRGTVQVLAVSGRGPDLPPVGEQATGTVRGRIVSHRAGVARAAVEICESPAMMFRLSPCDTAVFRKRVATAEDGSFELDRIPVGSYGFAIRPAPDAKWLLTTSADCCEKLRGGQVYDVGSLSIDR